MASHKDRLKSELREILDILEIKDETYMVSTHSGSPDKAHLELRNYQNMIIDFIMSMPESIRDTEINILRNKAERVKNGEPLKDVMKLED